MGKATQADFPKPARNPIAPLFCLTTRDSHRRENIARLDKAADLGVKLGDEGRHTLTVEPVSRCPRAFADTLKDHKWLLLDLLRLPFVMVFSEALGETIFLCEDEDTKASLVEAGAS